MKEKRSTLFAGIDPVLGCAILAAALAALTVAGARAQDVFSGGSNTAPSQNSGKTGTQGVNGNPFCPPPVIIVDGVATTPRNWSCRGDAQAYQTKPAKSGNGGGSRTTVSPYDPNWSEQFPQNVPRPAPTAPGNGAQEQYRKPPMPTGQISPGYDAEYQCTRSPPMPKGQISPGYDSEYRCTRRDTMPKGQISPGYASEYHCTRKEPMTPGMIGTGYDTGYQCTRSTEVRTNPGVGFSVQINR
jgi:hypothetical protein